MMYKKKYIQRIEEQNRDLWNRLERYHISFEEQNRSVDRIKNSRVVFKKTEGLENLYIDDRLDVGCELVIYDSETAIENSITRFFSKDMVGRVPGLSLVGYLEIEYCHKNYIKIDRLYVAPQYRRRGYATKMLERLLECAQFHGVETIELFASAGNGISQEDLERMYEKCGFQKKNANSSTMVCRLEKKPI